ncbi:Mitotic control protein dis3 [Spironucleus salmonicida]|uniref:Mitotic control protein dis3 n=1 Tax=Spironucleus salmonicida TaxID=348837 RepID=V6LYZ5_9EUKA|nr:Mitotic control protein dis3 [Spironucleus salmonicida]|eukprot:EST46054.1 Mitotic control protein dis3 [Spironucleus salmonicida]
MPLLKANKKQVLYETSAKRNIHFTKRNDIPCNIEQCEQCKDIEGYQPYFIKNQVLFLPQLSIFLKYKQYFSMIKQDNILYLQSILNNLKQKEILYHNSIIKSLQSKAQIFHDQVCSFTGLAGEYNETIAIQKIVPYFEEHGCQVIIITDHPENFSTDTIDVNNFYSEQVYQKLQISINLEEFLKLKEQDFIDGYIEHFTEDQLLSLIDTGALLSGQLATYKGGKMGEIKTSKVGRVLFPQKWNINRSLNLDIVAFRLQKENKEFKEQNIQESDLYPLVQEVYQEYEELFSIGVVVGILKHRKTTFCGTIEKHFDFTIDQNLLKIKNQNEQNFGACKVIPVDQYLPTFFIRSPNSLSPYIGQRCQFQYLSWERKSIIPSCTLLQALGPVGDRDAESEVILQEKNIRHFNLEQEQQILDELPSKILNQIDPFRVNLIDELVCSIDPPGCKDIDDALHMKQSTMPDFEKKWGKYCLDQINLKQLTQDFVKNLRSQVQKNNVLEVGVHIADVSHYVLPESYIDQEARKRCTSVYLQDRRIDMLPKLLTEQVCSLVADGERFTFSCMFLLDRDSGKVLFYRFCKTIIINKANLSYYEAQALLDAGSSVQINPKYNNIALKEKLVLSIQQLMNISLKLKQQRIDNGALLLDSPEAAFQLDAFGMPIKLDSHEHIPTMSLIEEFMLLANYYAAKQMLEKYPSIAFLRRHPEPDEEIFEDLKCKLEKYNLSIDTSSNLSLSQSIRKISDKLQDSTLLNTVRILLTRCMNLAKYFPSGTYTAPEFLHYGLALEFYTHFTSPIRRYADVCVHRLIGASIGVNQLPNYLGETEKVNSICQVCNERKEEADRAGRESGRVFGVIYLLMEQIKGGNDEVIAEIVGIRNNMVQIVVREFGADLDVKIEGEISADKTSLKTKEGLVYTIFQRVKARIYYDHEKPYYFRFKVDILEILQ